MKAAVILLEPFLTRQQNELATVISFRGRGIVESALGRSAARAKCPQGAGDEDERSVEIGRAHV